MKSLKPIKSYVILSQHHIRLTFLLSVDLLNCLLLIAPDTTTFWNYKRQSLQNNKLSSSCEIKIHSCIVQHDSYFNDDRFLQHELGVCNKFADKYRCDYCLWQYRRFLLMHLHKREVSYWKEEVSLYSFCDCN
ncbi:protein prenyltransferase alpha subunit repeat containing protein 1 [Schistosoma japonicum]|nr:protein prenyltransferase alpha subunit repeat containing protein 1 [Schistosoma japonicum]KAH8848827.1 protein prenyltransferase alpha subunit repeat containing protein 1 [Schistosoma japonicum]